MKFRRKTDIWGTFSFPGEKLLRDHYKLLVCWFGSQSEEVSEKNRCSKFLNYWAMSPNYIGTKFKLIYDVPSKNVGEDSLFLYLFESILVQFSGSVIPVLFYSVTMYIREVMVRHRSSAKVKMPNDEDTKVRNIYLVWNILKLICVVTNLNSTELHAMFYEDAKTMHQTQTSTF